MQKIIFTMYSLDIGGAEKRCVTISNYLVNHGAQVQIILLDAPIVRFEVDSRIKIAYLKQNENINDLSENTSEIEIVHCKPAKDIGLLQKVKLHALKILNKEKHKAMSQQLFFEKTYISKLRQYLSKYPDWTVVSWMTFCNISTLTALKRLPNKAAFVECTSPDLEFPRGHHMNRLKESSYHRAQLAIFQTEEERDFYTYLPKTEKHIILNPIRDNLPDRHIGNRRHDIVNFCRLDKIKNLPLLIEAFSMIKKEFPDYTLTIYGDGPLKDELTDYAASLNIEDSVFINPFDRELHEKIRDCAMFVSSSDREGLSNSMLEALAIGIPTICTDCPAGGARMLITPYENGLLVPVHDVKAMYEAMKTIICNPELANKFSLNSIKIREKLSEETICRRWQQVLK